MLDRGGSFGGPMVWWRWEEGEERDAEECEEGLEVEEKEKVRR